MICSSFCVRYLSFIMYNSKSLGANRTKETLDLIEERLLKLRILLHLLENQPSKEVLLNIDEELIRLLEALEQKAKDDDRE